MAVIFRRTFLTLFDDFFENFKLFKTVNFKKRKLQFLIANFAVFLSLIQMYLNRYKILINFDSKIH